MQITYRVATRVDFCGGPSFPELQKSEVDRVNTSAGIRGDGIQLNLNNRKKLDYPCIGHQTGPLILNMFLGA